MEGIPNMKSILLLIGFIGLSSQERVRFMSHGGGGEQLPHTLHVQLEQEKLDSQDVFKLPSSFRLVRNPNIEHTKIMLDGEDSPLDAQKTAFYLDPEHDAIITANLVEHEGRKVRTLRGSFLKDGNVFTVEPESLPSPKLKLNRRENEGRQGGDEASVNGSHFHSVRLTYSGTSGAVRCSPTTIEGKEWCISKDVDGPEVELDDTKRAWDSIVHYDVEMLWVTDPAMYKEWTKHHDTGTEGFKQFIGHQLNSMDLPFWKLKNKSQRISVSIWVNYLFILTEDTFYPSEEGVLNITHPGSGKKIIDSAKVLEATADFKKANGWDFQTPDHFMVFTGYHVRGDGFGASPLSGVCVTREGVSVVEYIGWDTWRVAAHYLGRNLGMRKDGDNGCSRIAGNIMSPTITDSIEDLDDAATTNYFRFSGCSVGDMSRCLSGMDIARYPRKCVRHTDCSMKDGFVADTSKLPGEFVDLDTQCSDRFGDEVQGVCTYGHNTNICERLWCKAKNGSCIHGGARAADGTKCAYAKWCIQGLCVDYPDKPSWYTKECVDRATPEMPRSCHNMDPHMCRGNKNLHKYPGLNCPRIKNWCCHTCALYGFMP